MAASTTDIALPSLFLQARMLVLIVHIQDYYSHQMFLNYDGHHKIYTSWRSTAVLALQYKSVSSALSVAHNYEKIVNRQCWGYDSGHFVADLLSVKSDQCLPSSLGPCRRGFFQPGHSIFKMAKFRLDFCTSLSHTSTLHAEQTLGQQDPERIFPE